METLRALQELDEKKERAVFMYGLCRQNLNCGLYCGKAGKGDMLRLLAGTCLGKP